MHPQKQLDTVGVNECPTCAAPMDGTNLMEGEVVTCKGCSAELEVVSLTPLRFEEAPEVEEDWGE
ncbi:lysine biosynthesis protein LysW [Myxococcus sp. RHSTA-1-4]|uniref:lysine biosynthesis protein LysW n=1 Tax=Myxococcus sp. RHSTA-1-4 TaxID=2874601 RepID=UPI001CBD9216|nr:lysine biosynthesis protein LysW [Myxococcus sp. RHSTA-1-4]MBZ4414938.1 lysine biosynthesis protein LysW [Myxococcus sp. RHSTA-1-4]